MSEFLTASSLKINDDDVAGYIWRRAAANCVYAALPSSVGLLVTKFRSIVTRGESHLGFFGKACDL